MKRLLAVVLLEGIACAQAATPPALSANERVPPSALTPGSPAVTANNPDAARGLPDLLAKPEGRPTLVGGTIFKVDQLRDEMTIKTFGGGSTRVVFDPRTKFYRDGATASAKDLKNGDRVYVDTMLAGKAIFAKNIRVITQAAGQSVGQVVRYDARRGELVLNDSISPNNVKIRLLPTTTVVAQDKSTMSANQLVPGTLVSIAFLPIEGGHAVARQISVVATPGNSFVFVGRVAHLDLHLGLLVVVDPRDQRSYEIRFDPRVIGVSDDLREGVTVEATTRFNGSRYVASAIRVQGNPSQ